MSKGDEYAEAMPKILVCMYNAGAADLEHTLHLDAIAKEVGLQPKELRAVMRVLQEQGKVTRVVGKRYRLTGPGFKEAQRLVSQRQDQADHTPKRPVGFQLPDDHDSGSGGGG